MIGLLNTLASVALGLPVCALLIYVMAVKAWEGPR